MCSALLIIVSVHYAVSNFSDSDGDHAGPSATRTKVGQARRQRGRVPNRHDFVEGALSQQIKSATRDMVQQKKVCASVNYLTLGGEEICKPPIGKLNAT